MRITRQLLRSHSSVPLGELESLNLSCNDIIVIERLEVCKSLQRLVLTGNRIDSIRNLYSCRQLWTINLAGNKVKSLAGLSRFPVLGSLNLGGNELDWQELKHISHMTILSLTLLGNDKLDSDTHYRDHVVDTLPHVWMLDGRMITAEEKRNVSQIFLKSKSSTQPVRHKLPERVFVPTSMKNLLVTGVFGERTTHLMSRFPVHYTHNTEMDKKRLTYLAYSVHQDLLLQQGSGGPELPSLESLVEERAHEIEQANMLLLLLLAGLEYDLPHELMKATLETAKLNYICGVNCVDLLGLPPHMILDYASLLLSAAALDREEKKSEGSLYSALFKSLCVTMDSVQKRLLSQKCHSDKSNVGTPRKANQMKEDYINHCHCLLSSEIIHLMCLVPLFFECMESSKGLMRMISVATKTSNVSDVIGSIAWKVQAKGGDMWDVYHNVASFLLESTSANVKGRRMTRKHTTTVKHTTSQLLQATQPRSPGRTLRALSAGAVSRKLRGRPSSRSASYSRAHKQPELGDLVLVSDNQAARIVALPESGVAVLQMNSKTVLSCPPDSYFYTETSGFVWERALGCWTKDSLAADLSRSHLTPSPPQSTLASSSSLDESEYLRSETPSDMSSYYNPAVYGGRPVSQLSYRSDDLQTIPSQDELEESDYEEQPTEMRIDVAPSNTTTTSSPQLEHRKHILQQYSTHSLTPEPSTDTEALTPRRSPKEEETRDILLASTVPPKVNLVDTWEADKSIANSGLSSKPHSCSQIDSAKESSKVEPHMSPMTSYNTMRPFQTGARKPAVLHDAWTVAKPNVNVKSSTPTRQMVRRQPKTPPLTRKTNSLSGHRPDSRGSSHSTVAQHSRAATPSASTSRQQRNQPKQIAVGRYHFHQPLHKSLPTTRKLGDMRNLYIGGTSIG